MLRHLGRTGFFVLWTLLLTVVVLLGVIWVMEKGPSPTMTTIFCRSMRETSTIRWIPNIFLTDEEIDALKSDNTENVETEAVNTSLIHVAAGLRRGRRKRRRARPGADRHLLRHGQGKAADRQRSLPGHPGHL